MDIYGIVVFNPNKSLFDLEEEGHVFTTSLSRPLFQHVIYLFVHCFY